MINGALLWHNVQVSIGGATGGCFKLEAYSSMLAQNDIGKVLNNTFLGYIRTPCINHIAGHPILLSIS